MRLGLAEPEKAEHADNKSADEVVRVAVEHCLEDQTFVERNGSRARVKGIGERDVARLIAESRRDNHRAGR
jgi:hypothetical protein